MRDTNLVRKISLLSGTLAATALAATPNTPLMGWASWNKFALDITADLIKAQADAMVSSGLSDVGYKYINIDDGFFDGRADDGTLKINATAFPGGFKPVVDYIHSKGLKAGFYTDAGSNTCGNMYGPETGGKGGGIYGHDQQDIDLAFKTWGFDYIKVDYCGGRAQGLDEQTRYTAIRKAIDSTGRTDIVYNICRWQFPGGWVASVGNSWRIADDIGASWSSLTRILDTNTYLAGFSSPGHYNDMDMLEVGNGMSAEEDKSQFALWCVLSSPLVLGNDMSKMSATTKALLTNTEAIAISQDTSGIQATKLSDDGNGGQVWGRRLHGFASKERAVVLFNRSSSAKSISVSWKDLDLEGSATVRDLLNHKDLGSFENAFSSSVPSHGAVFVAITGSNSKLQETFEAENSWMNNFKWTKNVSIQANQAAPALNSSCSRGAMVGYVGKSAANFVEFRNVHAHADGGYRLTIRYLCGENRSATMSVNGKDTLLSNLNSGSYTKPDSVTIPVALKAGPNTIRFSNTTAFAPDLDAIRVDVNSVSTAIAPPSRDRAANLNLRLLQADGNMEVRGDAPLQSLLVYDRSGSLVARADGASISLRNLKPGTYSLKAISTEGFEIRSFAKL
jgi:hypothetical protein